MTREITLEKLAEIINSLSRESKIRILERLIGIWDTELDETEDGVYMEIRIERLKNPGFMPSELKVI